MRRNGMMKKAIKSLAKKTMVCMTACAMLAAVYTPIKVEAAETSNTIKGFSKAPTIDGKVEDGEWGEALFVVKEGEKNITVMMEKDNAEAKLTPFTADVYVGYDSTHVYVAAVAEYENHLNETIKSGDLWRGDCMQIQISAVSGAKRNEFNFSNNSVSGKSMVDAPYCTGNFSMQGGEGKDFIVVRDGNTTTYEMAISLDQFTKDVTKLEEGMTIPFSVAFHQSSGAFLEYCAGIVKEKDISLAGNLVLGEGAESSGKDNNSDVKGQDDSKDKKSQDGNKMLPIYIVIGVAVVVIAAIVVIFVMGNRKFGKEEIEDSDDNEK